ncbi:MAG TPA: hypothetical protein DCS07_06900 [Bdellovibrionales bacterium]|nr:hypothetical protein [Bdellovibrionales bacterium]
MKSNIWINISSAIAISTLLLSSAPAFADRIQLLAMSSGPSPRIDCQFDISVDPSNNLTGAAYSCAGEDLETDGVDQPQTMTLAQLRSGVVFMRHSEFSIEIINVSARHLDRETGGRIRIRYLKNAMLMTYGDFYAVLERIGDLWIAYTEDQNGRRPMTRMIVITGLLGVKKIRAQ